jgi:transposase
MIEDTIEVLLFTKNQCANCPVCGSITNEVHSTYNRTILDLPIVNTKLILTVVTKRYFCTNENCYRKIFCMRLTDFAQAYARRTNRLELILEKISVIISSISGSKLSDYLNIRISNSTFIRITRRIELNLNYNLEVIGVDDFAYKKNYIYGTIVCDHSTHSVIDIFEGRDSEDLGNWLETQSGIEVITRDGSQAYKGAIDTYNENIVQINDRFHILNNLLKYLIEYVKSNFSSKTKVLKLVDISHNSIQIKEEHEKNEISDKQKKKLEVVREVKKLYEKNYNINKIANILKLNWRTAKRYIIENEDKLIRKNIVNPRRSMVDDYINIVAEMLKDNHNITSIFKRLCLLGFKGKYGTLKYYIKNKMDLLGSNEYNNESNYDIITHNEIISNIWNGEEFSEDKEKLLHEQSGEFELARNIVKDFRSIVKEKDSEKIEHWIKYVLNSGIKQFISFANGLLQDIEAVKNAIKYPYSNGLVEGHINKLKVIKRIMYGRANFDLLRIKCLYKI